jgi:DNA replication protein DnaC
MNSLSKGKTMPSKPASLQEGLRRLCLYNTLRHSQELIEKAAKDNLSHQQFLEVLIEEEMAFRHEKAVVRLMKEARFETIKTLDTFDWSHPTSIPKSHILHFFNLQFIESKEHLIFLGSAGVGKTHLAKAIGFAACQREYKTLFATAADMINHLVASQADHSLDRALRRYTGPKLLIIDELGYLPLDKQGRDLFFQVISKRSQSGSMILTTNKPFKDWGEVFQDNAVASAIAERLIEHGELIKIEGSSYRLKKKRQQALGLDGLNDKK